MRGKPSTGNREPGTLNILQRLTLLVVLLGVLAFAAASSASRSPAPTTSALELYQIGESKLLVIQNERPLTDAELETLIRKLNSSPFLLP